MTLLKSVQAVILTKKKKKKRGSMKLSLILNNLLKIKP